METLPLFKPEYRTYSVNRKAREPLLDFMLQALRGEGCQILYNSPPDEAPFRITFETPEGERMGIVAYAFFANSRLTRNRPKDEHRFQLKYGSKYDNQPHELWQDPFRLYTTILVGINTELGFFVGADPVLHNPTRIFISIEFKQHHVDEILRKGWYVWERERKRASKEPVEVLVGGAPSSFLSYIRLEREAVGEDQGHRQLIAEKALRSPLTVHSLSEEFQLSEREVLDVIQNANRLKVAVRGWVAEEHLFRQLEGLPGIQCSRLPGDGPDLKVRVSDDKDLTIECKNVLRKRDKNGYARLDFQRTRAAKSDPCSRYYSPKDFDVVAACLHAVTENWEFQFALPARLDPHAKCPGKLSSNVHVDERWSRDPLQILREAAALLRN